MATAGEATPIRRDDEPSSTATAKAVSASPAPKKKTMVHHLFAGGAAGFVESSCWYVALASLDVHKHEARYPVSSIAFSSPHSRTPCVMCLLDQPPARHDQDAHAAACRLGQQVRPLPDRLPHRTKGVVPRALQGQTAALPPLSLLLHCSRICHDLQGLTAVYMGIVPKMAVRFSSFEAYKDLLAGPDGKVGKTLEERRYRAHQFILIQVSAEIPHFFHVFPSIY